MTKGKEELRTLMLMTFSAPSRITLTLRSSFFSLSFLNCRSFCQSLIEPTTTTIITATMIATPSTQSTGGSVHVCPLPHENVSRFVPKSWNRPSARETTAAIVRRTYRKWEQDALVHSPLAASAYMIRKDSSRHHDHDTARRCITIRL